MNRVSRSGDELIVGQITALRQDLDGLKSVQRVGGSAVATFVTQTSSGYDATSTAGNSAGASVRVTFTASQQSYPFARLTYRLYVGSPSTEIHPDSTLWPNVLVQPRTADPSSPRIVTWDVKSWSAVTGTRTYYWKWYVHATDTGVVS